MLKGSQPLDPNVCKKLGLKENNGCEDDIYSDRNIKSQHIGEMFDDLFSFGRKHGVSLKTRFAWKRRDIAGRFHDIKYAVRNRIKWRKTLNILRPWEGFDGLFLVMQTHLADYISTEEECGHSHREYKNRKIATAKETVELLSRMREPDEYLHRRREEVEAKYPRYKSLITEYHSGALSSCGDFVAQGKGFSGKESGRNPREGYFEFVDGVFELTDSPDQGETDRLLAELSKYHEDLGDAYRQAEADSDRDFERLGHLLKDNLYSWWD